MGQNLVTTAYINKNVTQINDASIEKTNNTSIPTECPMHQPKTTPIKELPQKTPLVHNYKDHHHMLQMSMNDIPSECPMHQAKNTNTQKSAVDSGCPIKHDDKSDINPNNMVKRNF